MIISPISGRLWEYFNNNICPMQKQKSRPNVRKKTKNIHCPTMHHDAIVCVCGLCVYVSVRQRKNRMLNMFLRQKWEGRVKGICKTTINTVSFSGERRRRREREKPLKKAKNIDRWGRGGHKNMEQKWRCISVLVPRGRRWRKRRPQCSSGD